ncbi:hypothetical protein CMO92_04030 [Candidatus Woesearchaeota archaeon]|nr:hypothetical protein [Candidatus Woesearchaeota archaeon]|tara:strand:+ start:227 stop:985 length:759 start_codon:yes stop_codon:yes gene_type:complete
MAFGNLLDPIFGPLLNWPILLALAILSLLITVIITLITKYATNQTEMKRLKQDMKKYQKEMKSHKADPAQMMKVQKKAMSANTAYMKHSFRSMLWTLVPILIIFSWMNLHLAYEPILPNQEFELTATFSKGVTGQATLSALPELNYISNPTQNISAGLAKWKLGGDAGTYLLTLTHEGQSVEQQILISSEKEYLPPLTKHRGAIKSLKVELEKVKPLGNSFTLFGYQPGWLFTYILFSILFSSILRKVLDVY